ncbi:unnamed protein product [Alternaria alternata]
MAPSRIDYDVSWDVNHSETTHSHAIPRKGEGKLHLAKNEFRPLVPHAWVGNQIEEKQYLIVLTDEERREAERAAKKFIASEKPAGLITPTSFPLPTLGPRLESAKLGLSQGLGFFVVRGLTPDKYDNQMNIVLYVGLSSYISTVRAVQYSGGPVLTHVVDLSSAEDQMKHQGKWIGSGNQNTHLPFHTDNGHILCLYSIHSVLHGGYSRLASSQKIIDTLREKRPDLIDVLSRDWEWDTFNTDKPVGDQRPLLYEQDGRTILSYSRRPLIGLPDYPRRAALEPLTDIQVEALNTLEHLANQFAFAFEFRTGDIQFVNNLALLHGREAFRCREVVGTRRHLLRMFLKDGDDDYPLPNKLQSIMQELYDHDVEEEMFPWSLAPLPYVLSP